jgi:hypothetical protein
MIDLQAELARIDRERTQAERDKPTRDWLWAVLIVLILIVGIGIVGSPEIIKAIQMVTR